MAPLNAANVLFLLVEAEANGWKMSVTELDIPTKSNRVDIGVRVELPAVIFSHLTDELYESKIVYRTEKFEDNVRTFCMNPSRYCCKRKYKRHCNGQRTQLRRCEDNAD